MSETQEFLDFQGATARDRLIDALRIELLGPEAPDEVLKQSPNTRYLVGMLAPGGTPLDPVEDDAMENSEGEEQSDGQVPLAASLDPSSIGISFAVGSDSPPVRVSLRWGRYEKVEKAEEEVADESTSLERDDDPEATANRKKRRAIEWPRTQHEVVHELELAPTEGLRIEDVADGVQLQWIGRALGDAIVFSVFLVNSLEAPSDRRPPDEDWLYQPEIEVIAKSASIVARDTEIGKVNPDPDIASADLTYRHRRELATGHGVSTDWHLADGSVDRATRVWTTVIPQTEVPIVSPAGAGIDPIEMDDLAAATGEKLAVLLTPLADAYAAWIEDRRAELSDVTEGLRQVGSDHLDVASDALARMREGIEVLRTDSDLHQ